MKKIKKLLTKAVLTVLSIIVFLFAVTPQALAAEDDSTWYSQPFYEWYSKVYDNNNPQEIFGERYTAAQVQWVFYSIPAMIFNFILGNNTDMGQCLVLMFGSKTASLDKCGEGILNIFKIIPPNPNYTGSVTKGSPLAVFKNVFNKDRQFSGISYFRNIARNLHIIPKAEAAEGFGYNALGPVTNIWKVSRDFAYSIFVIAIIVFAFMIMFKVKINPQTVITVQSALPKVIVAMILTTFSFAIAGFVIDLMYVIIAFLSIIVAPLWAHDVQWAYLFMSGSFGEWVPIVGAVTNGVVTLLIYFVAYLLIYFAAVIVAVVAAGTALDVGGFIVGLVLLVGVIVVALIAIINLFKIVIMLYKALAQIFLLTIIGPIQIALGVLIPQMGFGAWLKSLISNVLIFPAVGLFFLLAFMFLIRSFPLSWKVITNNNFLMQMGDGFAKWFGTDVAAMQDVSGSGIAWSPPFLGGGAIALAYIFISLTLITIMPKIGKMIESFFNGRPFDMESALGETVGKPLEGAWGMTGAPVMRTMQEFGSYGYASSISKFLGDLRFLPKAIRERFKGTAEVLEVKRGRTGVGASEQADPNKYSSNRKG